jgi:hypothetical protein
MVAVLAYLSLMSAVFAALSGWAFAIYARMTPRDVNMLGWSSVATVLFTGVTLFLLRAMQNV